MCFIIKAINGHLMVIQVSLPSEANLDDMPRYKVTGDSWISGSGSGPVIVKLETPLRITPGECASWAHGAEGVVGYDIANEKGKETFFY